MILTPYIEKTITAIFDIFTGAAAAGAVEVLLLLLEEVEEDLDLVERLLNFRSKEDIVGMVLLISNTSRSFRVGYLYHSFSPKSLQGSEGSSELLLFQSPPWHGPAIEDG